jgi:hypothetical protein
MAPQSIGGLALPRPGPPPAAASASVPDAVNQQQAAPVPKLRSAFPETWLFVDSHCEWVVQLLFFYFSTFKCLKVFFMRTVLVVLHIIKQDLLELFFFNHCVHYFCIVQVLLCQLILNVLSTEACPKRLF